MEARDAHRAQPPGLPGASGGSHRVQAASDTEERLRRLVTILLNHASFTASQAGGLQVTYPHFVPVTMLMRLAPDWSCSQDGLRSRWPLAEGAMAPDPVVRLPVLRRQYFHIRQRVENLPVQ